MQSMQITDHNVFPNAINSVTLFVIWLRAYRHYGVTSNDFDIYILRASEHAIRLSKFRMI